MHAYSWSHLLKNSQKVVAVWSLRIKTWDVLNKFGPGKQ